MSPIAWSPAVLRRLVPRTVLLWVGLRGISIVVLGALVPAVPAAALIVGLAAFLLLLELRRTRADRFLANLGISVSQLFAVAAVSAGILELILDRTLIWWITS
jgi:hypothetical protein